ncbi:hypothetical protein LJC22_02330 [Desulfosarcina sp. OttesenSCG-928-G10]|nr:hypothetical protein [Desulfosarcina sp. OttesenSCG-928-G10]
MDDDTPNESYGPQTEITTEISEPEHTEMNEAQTTADDQRSEFDASPEGNINDTQQTSDAVSEEHTEISEDDTPPAPVPFGEIIEEPTDAGKKSQPHCHRPPPVHHSACRHHFVYRKQPDCRERVPRGLDGKKGTVLYPVAGPAANQGVGGGVEFFMLLCWPTSHSRLRPIREEIRYFLSPSGMFGKQPFVDAEL